MTDGTTTASGDTTATAATVPTRLSRLRSWAKPGRPGAAAMATAAVLGVGLVGVIVATGGPSATTASVAAAGGSADKRANGADRSGPGSNPAALGPAAKKAVPQASASAPTGSDPSRLGATTAGAWVLPQPGAEVTSCYGPRWGRFHEGIDFAGPPGSPNRAAAAGTVISAGWDDGGYGNMVIIRHASGIYTLYGHANSVAVSVGQHVEADQIVSYEGSTGSSTGPHLHFEVWTGMWSPIDPAPFLRAHGIRFTGC